MKLGLSSYTFPWAIGIPGYENDHCMSPIELVEATKELGGSVLQLADNMPVHAFEAAQRREIVAAAAGAGIELELGTKGLGGENLERYLELAAEMQASVLRAVPEIDLQPGDVRAVNCAVQRTAAELKKIVSDLERAEITLCIENYEGWPVAALAGVVEMLDSPHIRICLDTVNSLGRGEDLEKVVTTLAPLVGNLHIKDFVTRRVPHRLGFVIEGAPAGAGLLPVREILGKMLPTISVILEQWTPLGDSIAETVACEHGWAKEGMSVLRVMLEG